MILNSFDQKIIISAAASDQHSPFLLGKADAICLAICSVKVRILSSIRNVKTIR